MIPEVYKIMERCQRFIQKIVPYIVGLCFANDII